MIFISNLKFSEITSGQLSIVKLVEELGALLVDVSPSNRELGTWVLTHVLEGLPAKHFDKKQLDFICAFYIDRLKDHHQVHIFQNWKARVIILIF